MSGLFGPVVDADAVLDAEPHRVRVVRVALCQAELALDLIVGKTFTPVEFCQSSLDLRQKYEALDRVVDAQAAERDAARLAVIRPTTRAAVARDMMPRAGVAKGQLAAAAAATQQSGQ